MPLTKTLYDDDGRLKWVHWSLPGELVDERAYVSQFTAKGIAPGFKHSCFTQVEYDVEGVFTRISDYFVKHKGDVAGAYFVSAAACGYIGLFFSDRSEQARFVLEMGEHKPDPDSAVHFTINHAAFEKNILINQERVKERLPDVFAMNARPIRPVSFKSLEMPEMPKRNDLAPVNGGASSGVNGAINGATNGVVDEAVSSALNGTLNGSFNGGANGDEKASVEASVGARVGAVRIGAVRMKSLVGAPK